MTEKKIFSLDRIEGDIAVCVSDDDTVINMPISLLEGLGVNDVFSAVIRENTLTEITLMNDERDRRIAENRARILAIKRRSKK